MIEDKERIIKEIKSQNYQKLTYGDLEKKLESESIKNEELLILVNTNFTSTKENKKIYSFALEKSEMQQKGNKSWQEILDIATQKIESDNKFPDKPYKYIILVANLRDLELSALKLIKAIKEKAKVGLIVIDPVKIFFYEDEDKDKLEIFKKILSDLKEQKAKKVVVFLGSKKKKEELPTELEKSKEKYKELELEYKSIQEFKKESKELKVDGVIIYDYSNIELSNKDSEKLKNEEKENFYNAMKVAENNIYFLVNKSEYLKPENGNYIRLQKYFIYEMLKYGVHFKTEYEKLPEDLKKFIKEPKKTEEPEKTDFFKKIQALMKNNKKELVLGLLGTIRTILTEIITNLLSEKLK